jgi:excisionase family DNA binding protein
MAKDSSMTARYMNKKEAAAELRISERHLSDLIVQHQLPILRLGRRIIFDEAAFKALEEACRVKPMPKFSLAPPFPVRVPPRRSTSYAQVMAKLAERKEARRKTRQQERERQIRDAKSALRVKSKLTATSG